MARSLAESLAEAHHESTLGGSASSALEESLQSWWKIKTGKAAFSMQKERAGTPEASPTLRLITELDVMTDILGGQN